MVSVEEINDAVESPPSLTQSTDNAAVVPASQDRLLDAQEIETLAASASRPTVRIHLEGLAKRLKKEGEALKRMEDMQAAPSQSTPSAEPSTDKPANGTATTEDSAPAKPTAQSVTRLQPQTPSKSPLQAFHTIDRFSFDAGSYNAPFVTLYVPLPGVGSIDKDQIKCTFTKDSLDLIVTNLKGKSYRLFKDHLEKEIDPTKSKYITKSDEVRIKLAKIKTSEYGGYDYWSKLTDTKKTKDKVGKGDPSKSIMQLMKDMYEDGDDNMRKVIGETMMQQQRGELGKDREYGKGVGGFDDDDNDNDDFGM
jgi:calcyclin binding protein